MRPEGQDLVLLWDMLTYSERVVELVSRTHPLALSDDWALQLAMERALEIIGEAAKNVSPEFRSEHPEIPWRKIIAQRNFLAHEYGEVRAERLWETALIHVPELVNLLKPLLPK